MGLISIAQALQNSIKLLSSSAAVIDSAKLDSEILLLRVLNDSSKTTLRTKTWLLTWPEKQLTLEQSRKFEQYLNLRSKGMPVAYITGEKDFWTFTLKVNSDTLIPRPETELLVEVALEKIPFDVHYQVLDLGTGSGAIALAIASERENCSLLATDDSQAALNIARYNANKLKLSNIDFMQSYWFDAITKQRINKKFDLIVSNPPYIAKDDPHLEDNVRQYEPLSALLSENQGLNDIKQIIQQCSDYLNNSGWIIFEHGFEQAEAVQCLLKEYGFIKVDTYNDLNHHSRVTLGQWNC